MIVSDDVVTDTQAGEFVELKATVVFNGRLVFSGTKLLTGVGE